MTLLQRQINPHFLFNSRLTRSLRLIRLKPDLAREMIGKLATILRVLLKDREAFVPLREELSFIDDYLAIEVVRFGDKLHVVKEIAEETMDVVVPSMLLQPLIENSIKHGLEPRIHGGTVTLRSRIVSDRLVLEVEDDGLGILPERVVSEESSETVRRPGLGVGMRNVRERMQVLYGGLATVEMNGSPGRGTQVMLSMPILDLGAEEWARAALAGMQDGWAKSRRSGSGAHALVARLADGTRLPTDDLFVVALVERNHAGRAEVILSCAPTICGHGIQTILILQQCECGLTHPLNIPN